MSEQNYFNDSPISIPTDDRFGVNPFAESLARSIENIKGPVGTTIAINGTWGSGKSSAVNLIKHHLSSHDSNEQIKIVEFNCWWFRGEEALTLAFLQELNAGLGKNLSKQAKDAIPKLGKLLLQAGPVIGDAISLYGNGALGRIFCSSMSYVKGLFQDGETVEKIFKQIYKELEAQEKRFLIIIDDIDRLSLDEALLVFRLVKSIGRLPNVIYLLVFDRVLAEEAVKGKYPSEGPHFLEKIIQASFELPLPTRSDLAEASLLEIERICAHDLQEGQVTRFMNIFYDIVFPYLITPRDLVRLSNNLEVSWPPIAKEVNLEDFIALEIIRLFEPKIYTAIKSNKERVCGLGSTQSNDDNKKELNFFLESVPEKKKEQVKVAMIRLFPKFEDVGYSEEFIAEWEAERRVCTEKHFETYFRMSISDEAISMNEMETFFEKCGDVEYVKKVFREYKNSIRKNGKSKVPLLLNELKVYANKIEKEKIGALVSGVFQIAGEIDRKEDADQGFWVFGNNFFRIHWLIRRLTLERFDLAERTELFLSACKVASISWLIDFSRSAIGQYFPNEGREPRPIEECLVGKEALDELKGLALSSIEHVAERGNLIEVNRLLELLIFWNNYAGDGGKAAKGWVSEQLENDISTAQLTKAFTSESQSYGMGITGLADRVSVVKKRVQVGSLELFVDIQEFRRRLEEIESNVTLPSPYNEYVGSFLEAWRKQESGEDN